MWLQANGGTVTSPSHDAMRAEWNGVAPFGAGSRPPSSSLVGHRLVPSKLRPPRLHLRLVPRDRVVAALQDARVPLVLISAPAGSGKSISLLQWAAQDDRPVGWVQLDAGDNDPVVFVTYIAAALDRMIGVDAQVFDLLTVRKPRVREEVIPRIGAALMLAPPFALVLDDGQFVENKECWDHVTTLLGHLPEGATVALASRCDPPLALARMRAHGALRELRLDALVLDRAETAQLLDLHGLSDDNETVTALLTATEGWVTGLYLAALASHGRDRGEWLGQVRGDQRDIAAFLLDEVFERQSADLQEFLLKTSILKQLTAPVCAALTGRADADAVLSTLARDNLFVTALDDHGEAFRYHHLFAELLESRLERLHADEVGPLHLKAAEWLDRNGEPAAAVEHWLAAGDVASTVAPVARTYYQYVESGRSESARRLLGLFSEQQLLDYPALAITAGCLYAGMIGTPEEQARWTSLMRAYRFEDERPSPDGATSLLSSYTMLMAELAPDGLTQMRDGFKLCCELETRSGDEWCLSAREGYAGALYLLGETQRALKAFLRLRRESSLPFDQAGLASFLALIAMDEGRWEEAEKQVSVATSVEAVLDLDSDPTFSSYVPAQLGYLRLLSHRRDPVTMEFARSVDAFAARMVHRAPWILLLTDVMLGEVALEQGDLTQARRWSARAAATVKEYPDAGMLGRRSRALAAAIGERMYGAPVTPAEQRVLDLLATHLTEKEIAGRLFLSAATVKTHRRSIYRKLGVNTRGEAVARARGLGLLPR